MPISDLDTFQVLTSAAYAMLGVAWWRYTQITWRYGEPLIGRSLMRLTVILTACTTIFWLDCAILQLVPEAVKQRRESWLMALWVVRSWAFLAIASGSRHHARMSVRKPRSRLWLVVNYAPAVAIAMLSATFERVVPGSFRDQVVVMNALLLTAVVCWFALAALQLRPAERSGGWSRGIGALGPRRRDVRMMMLGAAAIAVAVPLIVLGVGPHWIEFVIQFGAGFALSLPGLARIGAEAIRAVVVAAGTVAVAAVTLLGARAVVAPLAAVGLSNLADVVVIVALAAVAFGARDAMERFVDRAILRRRRAWAYAEALLRALPAEEGVHACARQAVQMVATVPGITGAAVILADGFSMAAGTVDIDALRGVWAILPEDAEERDRLLRTPPALLPEPFASTIARSEITGIATIVGARRVWGHLFVGTGAVVGTFGPDDEDSIRALTSQLGLLFDSASLIERAVAVERTLARAEKLATVGETAARIAHEIRNPVTAARSLAQLLARNPSSPRSPEQAALILEELERVERRVAMLLRFSRQDAVRIAPLALDDLARRTLGSLEGRLDDAGVRVDLDASVRVVAMGDPEKLHQVVVNLIENAVDAMAEQDSPRRLAVSVAQRDGRVCLRVADTGPGIPADAREHVFEPFFSGKPNGTGLGLAIAKHLVDAQGGALTLDAAVPHGTVATLTLPAGEATS